MPLLMQSQTKQTGSNMNEEEIAQLKSILSATNMFVNSFKNGLEDKINALPIEQQEEARKHIANTDFKGEMEKLNNAINKMNTYGR